MIADDTLAPTSQKISDNEVIAMGDENHNDVPPISESQDAWGANVYASAIRKSGERADPFMTSSGMPIAPLYGPQTPDPTLGLPGEYPYTRGVQPTMYRSRFWTMRQYAGFSSAEESNRRYRYLLNSGTTGLSVAFDLPTQMGYDPDHELAEGEVGKVGVSIASI